MSRSLAVVLLVACADPEPPVLELSTAPIDLAVGCGTTAERTLQIANPGGEPLDLELSTALAEVTVSPARATVEPGQTVELTIAASAPATAMPGPLVDGALQITSNAGTARVPLALRATGATVAFPPVVDFGTLLPGDGLQREIAVSVTGDRASEVIVQLATPSSPEFRIDGSGRAFTATLSTGAGERTHQATAAVAFAGAPVCMPPEPSITLTGVASNDTVRLDRTLIDFGDVSCGASGFVQVALANRGSRSVFFRATGDDPIGFLIVQAPGGATAGGNIAAGDEARIVVSHNVITRAPPGAFGGRLDVSIELDRLVKSIGVIATVRRPLLAVSVATIDFGDVPAGSSLSRTFTLSNTGNLAAAMSRITVERDVVLSPGTFQVGPGATRALTLTFTARGAPGTALDEFITLANDPSCERPVSVHAIGRVI